MEWNEVAAIRGYVLNGMSDLQILSLYEDPTTQLKVLDLINEARVKLNIYKKGVEISYG